MLSFSSVLHSTQEMSEISAGNDVVVVVVVDVDVDGVRRCL
jgi:hypothetical protein